VYHSLIWGTRSAIIFGVSVTIFAALIGVVVGAVSAYYGGFLNNLLMRVTDAFLSFPVIAGVVLIHQLITNALYDAGMRVYLSGSGNQTIIFVSPEGSMDVPQQLPEFLEFISQLDPILIAFLLFSWLTYARLMNAMIWNIKKTEYIEASRAMGSGPFRLIFKHLIPNSIAPVFVLAARDVGGMVLLQATFTFIGMGDSSIWGMLLATGRSWIISPGGILTFWWVFVPATVALILFGIGWNLLGDGLNEALNPRNA
jgi:peptide/nickel transport system permease protein